MKYLLVFSWHIGYCPKIASPLNANFECGFESWFIETWESSSGISWLKLGGC